MMSGSTRNSSDPPPYFYKLNPRQQNNWMKTTRRMEKNEELRRDYPEFQPPSNTTIIHIHHRTSTSTMNDLITRATLTRIYILDTESAKGEKCNHGALLQIQFVTPNNDPVIILIETYYLPHRETPLFIQIHKLLETIFNNDNRIISWGSFEDEIKNFTHLKLFNPGKVRYKINLQLYFRRWHNGDVTHPFAERSWPITCLS